jgi:hypothetical protein
MLGGGGGSGPLLLLGQLKNDSLVALLKKIFCTSSPRMTLKKHTKSSNFVSFFVAVSFLQYKYHLLEYLLTVFLSCKLNFTLIIQMKENYVLYVVTEYRRKNSIFIELASVVSRFRKIVRYHTV